MLAVSIYLKTKTPLIKNNSQMVCDWFSRAMLFFYISTTLYMYTCKNIREHKKNKKKKESFKIFKFFSILVVFEVSEVPNVISLLKYPIVFFKYLFVSSNFLQLILMKQNFHIYLISLFVDTSSVCVDYYKPLNQTRMTKKLVQLAFWASIGWTFA